MEKRVLITGATGFLGRAVAREMRGAGWTVFATGRDAGVGLSLQEEGFQFTSLELSEINSKFTSLVKQCDAVVHCAALTSPWGRLSDFTTCNVTATRNVIDACSATGVRLIHISSPSVSFGLFHQPGLSEDAPWPVPAANHYIRTKRTAETLIREAAGLSHIIIRPKALIGPRDTSLLPRVIRAARQGAFPQFTDGDPLLDLTPVEEAAIGIRLAAEAPESCLGATYHLTGGQPLAASKAMKLLFDSCGLKVRFFHYSDVDRPFQCGRT